MRSRKKITIHDVAKAAGVSRGTVSRAFNIHRNDINEDTKKRILSIARKMGYFPNLSARGLVKGKTECIGLVVPDLNNPFLCEMVTEIEKIAAEKDFASLLAISSNDFRTQQKILAKMAAGRVDGIIITPCEDRRSIRSINKLNKSKIIVSLKRFSGLLCDIVAYDDDEGVRMMVEYLISKGHRKIVYLYPDEPQWTVSTRLKAFRKTIKKNGIKGYYIRTNGHDPTSEEFTEIARKIISVNDKPTAIFAYTDFIALYLIKALRKLSIKVPDDISVAGFDNISLGTFAEPELTTIDINGAMLGKNAVETIFSKLENPEQQHLSLRDIKLVPRLIERNSVAQI